MSKMHSLINFEFSGRAVRVFERDALTRRHDDEKGVAIADTHGGARFCMEVAA